MRQKTMPKVTVLMPVYNGGPYLREAVESILGQTFGDFEFIILDDGSTDLSADIAASYKDRRIRLVRNVENIGLPASLNKGVSLARGAYIARMDQDDISLPGRLAMQVDFMDRHPETGVCGSWVKTIGGVEGQTWRYPTDHDSIRCGLIFGPTLAHPSVIMRWSLFADAGLFYDPAYRNSEDYELWVRASRRTRLSNIGEALLLFRVKSGQVAQDRVSDQMHNAIRVRRALLEELGVTPTEEEVSLHASLSLMKFKPERGYITQAEEWLNGLGEANKKTSVYPVPAFLRVLGMRWFEACNAASGLGPWAAKAYMGSPLAKAARPGVRRGLKFALRCAVLSGA